MSEDAYVDFGNVAATYRKHYEIGAGERYPANRIRLDIALGLLATIGPRRVLDVGCGSGRPLLAVLGRGLAAEGIDKAPAMVAECRAALAAAGHAEDLVREDDMEAPRTVAAGRFDCLLALGSVYYARDFAGTLARLTGLLAPGGHFVFSLRNDLFSLFSLNGYTARFLRERLMPWALVPAPLQTEVDDFLAERLSEPEVERRFKTVDERKVHSLSHNPLTVAAEVLAPAGLEMIGLHYYHFHALPPVFEHRHPDLFRRLGLAIEAPDDWRGAFMASAFVVHARKREEPGRGKSDGPPSK